jgi:hypothetical protein
MMQDYSFCASECDNKECFRHPSNIEQPRFPHSFSEFKNTEVCPLNKKNDDRDNERGLS